jgi:hypothetical protein
MAARALSRPEVGVEAVVLHVTGSTRIGFSARWPCQTVPVHDHLVLIVDVYEVIGESSAKPAETFPRTLQGLTDALYRASWLSVAGGPHLVLLGVRVIRRYEGGIGSVPARPELSRTAHQAGRGPEFS